MSEIEDLELLVETRTPMLLVETAETQRLEELLKRMATRTGRPAFRWALATGLERLDVAQSWGIETSEPPKMLKMLATTAEPGLYLLTDLHPYLDQPVVISLLREICNRASPHTLLVAAPALTAPGELRHVAVRFELKLPTREELKQLVLDEAAAWGSRNQKRVQAKAEVIDAVTRNLIGMTRSEAQRLVRHAIYDDGVLDDSDLPEIQKAKYALLDQGGVLSFEFKNVKLDEVAGMQNLKRWLEQRRSVFLSDTAPPGLDPPKGLLLLGVQGGGKSLAAKAVAGAWSLPLLRLDFATLYNKYYGETERNLRESLKTAALMAPCVLWIDEIEKGLASGGDDGGPGKRVLGTLLTWMAERRDKVFLVATANDIESLPPELLRKGRFDEIFFVDLPKDEARRKVFEIHLRKRGQDATTFDLAVLSTVAEGFSGAEIEQAVVSALYAAHSRSEPLATAHIEAEIKGTRPLSVVMAEKMLYLRAWASERTVPADG